MPRKTKEVNTVEPEEQAIAAAPEENVVVIATPGLITPKAFYATADFEIAKLDLKVEAGEQFIPPASWQRDRNQEAFLMAGKQKNSGGSSVGVAFSYLGEVVNPQEKEPEKRERRTHTVVLPLEER